MKIGQFSDTFLPIVDGVGRVVYNYAEQIALKGHESYVIAPLADTGYRGKFPFEIIDYISVVLPGLPQYKIGTPTTDTHFSQRVRAVPFDIIHAHTPFIAGNRAKSVSRRLGIPLVGSFHSKYYDDFYKITHMKSAARFGTDNVLQFFNKCDAVWAVSNASADVLREYGYQGDVFVVENGVAITDPDQSAALEVQEKYGLGDKPVLLFVGQLNWKKNIRTVLEAAALLKKRGLDFRLVLTGQGPDAEAICRTADELDIGERTIMTGHISDQRILNGLYLRSALFTFLSEYDNAPMVVREAAVMGTPSLLVRGSCAAEVVIDGMNGLLCRNDPTDAADQIERVLIYPDELGRLGQSARNTIPMGWSHIIDRALERYTELIARGKK